MEINKICPFRTYTLKQGKCESECQLFISDPTGSQGTCALSLLPDIKRAIVKLEETVANSTK
jgi:hypothetical protein